MSQGRRSEFQQSAMIIPSDVCGHIRKTDFYERLNGLLDLEFVYESTKPLYAKDIGRPSLDPVVFFKAMMVMFFDNVTYFRELEYELADSIAVRKFLGYAIHERTPDESTIRKTFAAMPDEMFNAVFDYVLDICQSRGMIKGKAITTDSTLIDANAAMDSLVHKELGCSNRDFFMAVRRKERAEREWRERVGPSDHADGATETKADEPQKKESKKKAHPQANMTWESETDPDAKVMSKRDQHAHLAYRADVSVDMDTGIIVAAGAESADMSDNADFLLRVDEAQIALQARGYEPVMSVDDSGHLTGPNLAGLEERGLESVITDLPRSYHWAPGFGRDDFTYDEANDQMVCPTGQILKVRQRCDDYTVYRCSQSACRACPHFGVCTKDKHGRNIRRSAYEKEIQANAERARSEEGRALRWSRMQRGEAPFAFFKQYGGLGRISTRGLDRANKRVVLAAACWNLLFVIKAQMRRGISSNLPKIGLYRRIILASGCLSDRLPAYTGRSSARCLGTAYGAA